MHESFKYAGELADLPHEKPDALEFYLGNDSFLPGDEEYWYQLIRAFKPVQIFEIGSGNSILMAIRAIQ